MRCVRTADQYPHVFLVVCLAGTRDWRTRRQRNPAGMEGCLDCGEYGKSRLRRISRRYVILWQPFDAPPCDAILNLRVDGKAIVRTVKLLRGVSKNRPMAMVHPLDDVAPFCPVFIPES